MQIISYFSFFFAIRNLNEGSCKTHVEFISGKGKTKLEYRVEN